MIMLHDPNMASKPVQISMDTDLLKRIERDPEAKRLGRSAFIRNAVATYLRAKSRRDIDAAIARAYGGQADAMLEEVETLIEAQSWPER